MTTVRDDTTEHRFVIEADGSVAELVYRVDVGRLVLVHTGVPDALGGRGYGSALVRAALERARREGLTVVPRCEFAQGWLEKHPGDVEGVEVEWPRPR